MLQMLVMLVMPSAFLVVMQGFARGYGQHPEHAMPNPQGMSRCQNFLEIPYKRLRMEDHVYQGMST